MLILLPLELICHIFNFLDMHTIACIAQTSSLLSQITKDIVFEIIKKNFKYNIDALIYLYLKNKAIYTSVKYKKYYVFKKKYNLWDNMNSSELYQFFLENEPFSEFLDEYCYDMIKKTTTEKKIAHYSYMRHQIMIQSKNLNLKNKIAYDVSEKLYDPNFIFKLNNKKNYLPVNNGVINLVNGEFRQRTKDDYFSIELDVEWKGLEFPTPDIDKFFSDIMLNDKIKINYIQKLLGLTITGNMDNDKLIIIFHGDGSNGKLTLMDLLFGLLYDYSESYSSILYMNLIWKRLVYVSDINDLNENLFYRLSFDQKFQIFSTTNFNPKFITNKKNIISIPFLAKFVDKKSFDKNNKIHKLRDLDIKEKLFEKLDQLLVWLVKGSIKYFKEGLEPCMFRV